MLQYPDDCKVRRTDFRRRNIRLTALRWSELDTVNRDVNRDIVPENGTGARRLKWTVASAAGD
jgi:predicted transglutaminase-like cysteine proteinase